MAKLFQSGGVRAKGVAGTLLTEKKASGRISVSAQFKMEAGEKADDEKGRPIEVGGTTLTWFATVTEKTRDRVVQSLTYAGCSDTVAERVIGAAEEGNCGKIPERFGFGEKVVSLDCSIDTYEGKTRTKINWVNNENGSRVANAPLVDLGLGNERPKQQNSAPKEKAPWETQ